MKPTDIWLHPDLLVSKRVGSRFPSTYELVAVDGYIHVRRVNPDLDAAILKMVEALENNRFTTRYEEEYNNDEVIEALEYYKKAKGE